MEDSADPMQTAPTTIPIITARRRDTKSSEKNTILPTPVWTETPRSSRTTRSSLRKRKSCPDNQSLDPAPIRIKKCRVDIRKDLPRTHSSRTSASCIGLALQEFFRRRFGIWWRREHDNPDTRRALKVELKKHLAEEIRHATFNTLTLPGNARRTNTTCKCYLHEYFHADVRLTFPDCYIQHHHKDQQDQDAAPAS